MYIGGLWEKISLDRFRTSLDSPCPPAWRRRAYTIFVIGESESARHRVQAASSTYRRHWEIAYYLCHAKIFPKLSDFTAAPTKIIRFIQTRDMHERCFPLYGEYCLVRETMQDEEWSRLSLYYGNWTVLDKTCVTNSYLNVAWISLYQCYCL